MITIKDDFGKNYVIKDLKKIQKTPFGFPFQKRKGRQ